jgi:hypothetical protein
MGENRIKRIRCLLCKGVAIGLNLDLLVCTLAKVAIGLNLDLLVCTLAKVAIGLNLDLLAVH